MDNLVDTTLQIYADAQAHLKAANAKYKVDMDMHRCRKAFQQRDLVIAHLQHNHFPRIHTKLEKRKYNPSHLARKINDNAYIFQLPIPRQLDISHSFNVANFFEYHQMIRSCTSLTRG